MSDEQVTPPQGADTEAMSTEADIARLMDIAKATPAPATEPAPAPGPGTASEPVTQPIEVVSPKPRRGRRKKATLPDELQQRLRVSKLAAKWWTDALSAVCRITNAQPFAPEEEDFQRQLLELYVDAKTQGEVEVKPEWLPLIALAVAFAPRVQPVSSATGRGLKRLWSWWRSRNAPPPKGD